ncbi:hypothetical protein WH47_02196 [Habropoda laboriosa]|uniref:Uncharacterized protein n=1 Tax=Habropoda laboriosa TaxID=597456 RepID=A0A0L7QZ38_9HYME|nr:hypothetical protein WH47_02196 [Habropoda laboriosa]
MRNFEAYTPSRSCRWLERPERGSSGWTADSAGGAIKRQQLHATNTSEDSAPQKGERTHADVHSGGELTSYPSAQLIHPSMRPYYRFSVRWLSIRAGDLTLRKRRNVSVRRMMVGKWGARGLVILFECLTSYFELLCTDDDLYVRSYTGTHGVLWRTPMPSRVAVVSLFFFPSRFHLRRNLSSHPLHALSLLPFAAS